MFSRSVFSRSARAGGKEPGGIRAIAIACLRLLTLPPLPPRPDCKVPLFFRRIALAARLLAAFPYRRFPDFHPRDLPFVGTCPPEV
jgi:hypothetical protein